MKFNYNKNKKPVCFKSFQITALLIFGAISTAHAAATLDVGLLEVNDWSGADVGSYKPFELIFSDQDYFAAETDFPYEVTIEYDSNAISISGGFGGEITFSGIYENPVSSFLFIAEEFDVVSLMGDLAITTLSITSATLAGTSLATVDYDLQLPSGPSPSVSTVLYQQHFL
ncbi:MAG: hypothetical protein L3J59_15820 [Methylococcaceae bacterium]|nr:hypothetical protein [Methylococcaceae bacterium]